MKNLETIFSQNPQSPIFTVLASIYYNKRSYKNAARVCQTGLKHDPNNIPGQYILAKLLLLKNDTLNAEKTLRNIIMTEPQHLNALLLLISVMEKLNRSLKTIGPYIKKSAQLYPSNTAVQNYYIQYCRPPQTVKKKAKKNTKSKEKRPDFILNSKLATKTLYKLFFSQQK